MTNDIQPLIESMLNESTYYDAVHELRELVEKQEIPAVHKLLTHDNPAIRAGAAFVLREKADVAGVPSLIDLVRYGVSYDSDTDFEIAYDSLVMIGEPAVPAILDVLQDEDSDVRFLAVHVLCSIGNPDTLPAVVAMLSDPHSGVREAVLACLNFFGEPALPILLELILSDDAHIRWIVEDTIRYIGLAAADGLFGLLDQEDERKRKSISGALWLLQTREPSESTLNRLFASLHQENVNLQKGAVETLSLLGTPEALAAVEEWRRKQQNQP